MIIYNIIFIKFRENTQGPIKCDKLMIYPISWRLEIIMVVFCHQELIKEVSWMVKERAGQDTTMIHPQTHVWHTQSINY